MPKGIYPRTAYHNMINSLGHKGLKQDVLTCQKRNWALKGRTRSTTEIQRASKSLKQHYAQNPEKFKGEDNPFFGKIHSQATRTHLSIIRKEKWLDADYRDRTTKAIMKAWHIKPNKAELALLNILDIHFPNKWKYVGDGQLIINGKCPDFLNINGKKSLIELFGDYFHKGENPQDRINIFKQYGYDTVIIWEHELKNIPLIVGKINDLLLCRDKHTGQATGGGRIIQLWHRARRQCRLQALTPCKCRWLSIRLSD